MTTIKLKFRPSMVQGKEGVLYFQIIHNRTVRCVNTGYHIFSKEWKKKEKSIMFTIDNEQRKEFLDSIQNDLKWEMKRFMELVNGTDSKVVNIDDIIKEFQKEIFDNKSVFDFLRLRIEQLRQLGRIRCSEIMDCTLRSFMHFRGGVDLNFSKFTTDVLEQYEAYLKIRGITRNTCSFYMRNLRTAYKLAINEGLTKDNQPFKNVYTGVDKTIKRAISINDIRKIKYLDFVRRPALDFARDMLMFSFYTRGMSFVDMAYLLKKNVVNGYIIYRRKKTGQQLIISIVPEIQTIISKYSSSTHYLLPIITIENGKEYKQYKNKLICINRNLKKIGEMVGLSIPLSTYVMRHSWATIARDKNIPLSIISKGLGHDNDFTTQIYLDSIQTSKIDKANRLILDDL